MNKAGNANDEEGYAIDGGSLDHNNIWMPLYGKGGRMFLWSPPPSIADVAWEEVLKAHIDLSSDWIEH